MSKTLKDTVKELRKLFPSFSDSELAELAIKQDNVKKGTGVTVSNLLVLVRESYWDTELTRLRVRKKSDGSMNLRDTSTYRVYDTDWKRLEAIFGSKDIAELTASDVTKVAARGSIFCPRISKSNCNVSRRTACCSAIQDMYSISRSVKRRDSIF